MKRLDRRQVFARGQGAIRLALLLTVSLMLIEGVTGWLSGSLSLLADAGHMLTDAATLALSLFAAWFATRPADAAKTYGYYRTEILAALANGLALWLLVVWIDVQAIARLHHPRLIHSGPMLAVAVLGLLGNLVSGWLLAKERTQSLNVQGAWLNVMSDALGSVGVIIAGLLIRWRGWTEADAAASLVIGLLIALNSWNLVKQSINILLEGAPRHPGLEEVVRAIHSLPGICEVHDIHLWTITTGMDAMSGHVVVDDVGQSADVLARLHALLSQRFHIAHTTFQLEPRSHQCQSASPLAHTVRFRRRAAPRR